MADVDPGYAQRQADRIRAYDEAMAQAHIDNPPHLLQREIDNCQLCDDVGYRPSGAVCDHVDRTATAARGIAACRAALAKLPKS
jgi:hypothetical protein